MRLLQGSWSEVLTLSLIFRTLPTTVAAASASAKESEAGLRRRLKFAPDFALTEAMALQIDLEEFYNHVSFHFPFHSRKIFGKSAILGNAPNPNLDFRKKRECPTTPLIFCCTILSFY